jgi:DNA-binding CsgD family transcriptional regulator/PAS domain-containing protein
MRKPSLEGPDEHSLLEAVGKVYAASVDPAAWGEALTAIGRLVGADAGLLQVARLPPARVAYVGFGVDPGRARAYVEHFAAVDLYLPAARAKTKAGDVIWEYEMIPPDHLSGTEIFEDYLRPQGLLGAGQSLGGILQNDARGLAFVQFVSHARRRRLAPGAARTLTTLLPHIRRAVDIQARVGEAELAEATLDQLQLGVVFLDARGRVLRLSRPAAETLGRRDGLEVRAEGLRASDRSEQSALERLIARTAAPGMGDDGGPGGVLGIRRPSGRRPLSLVAVPVSPAATLFSVALGTAVVLFIADPELGPPAGLMRTLSVLYGLTPAEAQTAALIAEGHAPREVAQVLEVSVHTVRTVIKRVFSKTGVDRQAALARLLARTMPPLGRRE